MSAPTPELKTLGRYNIERVLGKGAMGVVYEGVDPRLGRRVAIKTILKSHLDEDTGKDFAMRFVREAQAVARLNHPNIEILAGVLVEVALEDGLDRHAAAEA